MPVVTIEPAKINTIPYEEEQEDTIEFTITNHGLIRADNVRLVLPDQHPYLNFESVSTVELCYVTATDSKCSSKCTCTRTCSYMYWQHELGDYNALLV